MKIKFKYIIKIQNALMKIFEAEDEDKDYVDRKIVTQNNRAIKHYLDLIVCDNFTEVGNIETIEKDLINTIKKHNFNTNDLTFKPICDELRKLGYEII